MEKPPEPTPAASLLPLLAVVDSSKQNTGVQLTEEPHHLISVKNMKMNGKT